MKITLFFMLHFETLSFFIILRQIETLSSLRKRCMFNI